MLPKGIVFDLDDTLIAYDAVAETVWFSLCEQYAPRAAGCTAQSLFEAIRQTRTWYWGDAARHTQGRHNLKAARREVVRLALQNLAIDEQFADEIADAYSEARDEAVHLFPGAEVTLQQLVDRGVRLGLITNGTARQQRDKLERFGLERYFSTILIEGELGFGKPESQVYLQALADLHLQAEDVWIVGDNLEWEVAAPQRLGIYAIWHDYKAGGLPANSAVIPNRIITSIAELLEP